MRYCEICKNTNYSRQLNYRGMYLRILPPTLDSQAEAVDTELLKIQNSNYLIFGNNKR